MRTRRPVSPRPLSTSLSSFSSALAIAAVIGVATSARAANISWDGEGADSLWLTPANWFDSTNTINNVAPLATDDLTFGLGGATTVDLGSNQTANSILFSLSGFTLGTAATTNQLAVTSGNITVNTGVSGAINAVLTTPAALTKAGNGTLTLNAASTRTGTTAINAGTLAVTNLTAVGTGAVTVSGTGSTYEINTAAGTSAQAITVNNGGTFQWTQNAQLTLGPALDVTGTGGTVFVGGTGSTGKVLVNAGLVTSAAGSLLTKTGGGVLQLAGANAGFLGNLSIQAGTIEFQNVDSLGTAPKTVTVGGTGDFATGAVTNRNNIILNTGGTISANNAAAIYSGNFNVAGNGTIALRQFQSTGTANSFAITGPLSGSGNLNVTAPAAATLTLGSLATSLARTPDSSGYSGIITANTNATVVVNNLIGTGGLTLAGGSIQYKGINAASAVLGTPGVNAYYFNFGSNPGTVSPLFASAQLLGAPFFSARNDSLINLPQPVGNGYYPILPVPGFGVAGAGGINDGVMWKGLLTITTAGTYQFSGTDDDNQQLWIDGQSIGTLGVVSGQTNIGGAVTLSAGTHTIVVKTTQGTGGGYTTVSYNGPDTANATTLVGSVPNTLTNGSMTTAVGPVNFTASSTLDLSTDAITSTLNLGSGVTATLTSPTISGLTVSGATTLNGGTATLTVTSAALTFNGAIGQSVASNLTINGGYLATFNATNTYTGLTSVTAGELDLNATGGNSIPGNLTINAANALGPVNNVKLLQANQIADTSTVTVQSGILNIGAFNDTVGTLVLNGGTVNGTTGVLTVGTLNLQTGTVNARLAGTTGLAKSTAGTLILAGNNVYTGATTITDGVLIARGTNALGAGGAGNETTVSGTGSLQLQGANLAAEDLVTNGSGLVSTGLSTINSLTTGSVSTVFVPGGELIINGALNVAGGALTKTGAGTLTFASNQASLPAVTLLGGALGFSGTQSFGAATVPAGLAFQFNSDPSAGVSITAPAGTTVIANYAAANTLLSRITAASNGTLALATDSNAPLNFTGSSLKLGAQGLVTYGGTITPNAGAYQFGGPSVSGLAPNVLTLTTALTGANSVNVSGGILNLTASNNDAATANLFTGGVTVSGGGTVKVLNDPNLGAPGGVVTLNGGTLQYATVTQSNAAAQYAFLGSGIGNSARTINIGAGGGTLDVAARSFGGSALATTLANTITGDATTTLTKTGFGQLFVLQPIDGTGAGFKGNLVVAPNSGQFNILASGAVRGLASVTVGQSGIFQVDNNTNLGQNRQFTFNAQGGDKIGNTIPITLNGGQLLFQSRNVAFGTAVGSFEQVGTVTLGVGQSTIDVRRTGGGGGDLVLGNLIHTVGSGTVRFSAGSGTFGQAGDNIRLVPLQINGVAPVTNSFVGGWAVVNTGDFGAFLTQTAAGAAGGIGAYGATGFPAYAALTTATAPGAGGFVTGAIGSAAADVALGVAGDGQTFTVGALRLAGAATRAITFLGTTTAPDRLFVESGGILSDGNNNIRTIGANTSNFTRGILTAGSATATTPQELFFHNNSNTMTVHSVIIDNPNNAAATVRLVKDLDGQVNLTGTNTYSGGTAVFRGTLEAQSAQSLGTGDVTVKNSRLNINVAGATTSTAGYTLLDNAEVLLNNNTGVFTTTGDRFTVSAGSTIIGPGASNANQGLNSLTRVSTLTGGGQVVLAPDSIVGHQNFPNNDQNGVGNNTIKNLGTAADLYYGLSGTNSGVFSSVTVGAGTPWKGISTDRNGRTWANGTINANSDFYLQGMIRDGGLAALSLGADGGGSFAINNNAGKPISAFVIGQVIISDDAPIRMPGDLTFVLTPGTIFQTNRTNSLGNPALVGGGTAKVLVQAGATLDPGNFTAAGAAANQNTATRQNLVYPIASPLNGSVTVEAGGQFLINDASGIGSAMPGSWQMKAGSILHLGNSNAFFGRGDQPFTGNVDTTGYILPGQFVYEPGVVVRVDSDILGFSKFVTGEANGEKAIVEIYNANRNLTNQNNPFIVPVVGTPTIEAENVRIAGGGMLTNDDADRQLNEGRGRLILGDGAVLAGTTQTYINIQEGIEVEAGATITIGSTKWADGMPKLGGVQLLGPNSNSIPASATINMLNGSQIAFGATNVWPDGRALDLPTAVTAFPSAGAAALQPGTGASLLLNVGNFMEYVGHLTGNGAVIANQGGTALAINATSDFTSNVVFKNTNGQQPSLMKAGPATLTLTGNSDSQGLLVAQQGSVVVSNGTGDWGEVRPQRGASIVVDNTVNATNNRLGLPAFFVGQGGTFELKGNATTPVRESFNALASGAGNFIGQAQNSMISTLKVSPGAANTTLQFLSIENYVNTGQRLASYVINSPTVANGPMTYSAASAIVPNATNLGNGLVEVAVPNFGINGASGLGAGIIFGGSGTPVMPIRNDLLGDANGDGVPEGLVTQDGVNYTTTNTSGTNQVTGIPSTSGLSAGMLVTGAGIPAGTRIQSVDSATSVTLTNNTTAAATNLNVIVGGLRNLAASEYATGFRDNQTAGLNVKLAGTTNVTGDTRVQTVTLTPGSTLNINGTLPLNATSSRLQLNSSAIFVQPGGAATINGSTSGNSESYIHFIGNSGIFLHTWGDLNLNTKVHSDVGIVKTGPGTLNFGAGAFEGFRGSFQMDGGTVNLAAGNNVQNIRQQSGSTATNFYINAGTLNLNGNSQEINLLNSANELPGTGGTITSATPATITNIGGGRFAGVIGGAISLDKAANNTLLLTSAQTYTGTTTVRAGTLILRDSAQLSAGAGAIAVRDATLQLDNGYLSNVANRINPATPVTLNGGTINLTGAAAQVSQQTFNTLTLEGGLNNFASNAGGSGANELNVGNLIRTPGGGSVLNFNQNYGFIGTAGNNTTAIRYNITNVNGNPLALNDGILGGWAIVRGTNFATYRAGAGVGEMSNTADGFANYESGDVTTATATQNVNDGTARTLTATKTINSWRLAPGANIVNTFNNGVGLTIDTGGLLSDANVTISYNAAADARQNFITSGTGELVSWVNQNTNGINIPITGNIDFVKSGPGGMNINPASTLNGTVTSGSNLITTTNTTGLEIGDAVSGTGIPAGSVITAVNPGVSIQINNNATAAATTYVATFGNSYQGKTIVNGGTLTLNQAAAGSAAFAIPGDIYITGVGATVTEANVPGQINPASNVVIGGGGRLNLVNLPNVTETLRSLTILDGSSSNGTANGLDRTGSQLSSVINLTAPVAITSTNTNPATGVPFIGGFAGTIGFTNPTGSTLNITSGTDQNGVLSVGLRFGSRIGNVPTGIAEGGLIKSGNGLLTLDPDQNPTFAGGNTAVGSPLITGFASTAGFAPGQQISGTNIPAGSYIISVDGPTQITISANATVAGATGTITGQVYNFTNLATTPGDALNVSSGIVRADRHGSLGSPLAVTTVQNGAVLLGSNTASQIITGSVTLKSGSTLGATINSFTLGAATDVPANQTVLSVPSGSVHIAAYDYFIPSTNSGNITINGRLTGSGNINIFGQQLSQGNGGGGVITLGNPILTGTGSNDFSGTITVGTNAILANQVALIAKNTLITRTTGSALGAATINLNGGRLRLRDDGASTGDVNGLTVTYTNDVTLSADSFLDANRQTSTTVVNTVVNLGVLNVTAGTRALTVDSGNGYQVGFASLNGPGTFIKAGAGRLNINSIAPTFSGNIGIAGPQGLVVAPTFNTTGAQNLVLPATSNLTSFALNGLYITEASKTLNVSGAFSVNANPGDIASNKSNIAAALAVTNSTTLNVGSFVNNGSVGAAGGAATITSTGGFTGTGHFVTSGQQLNLAGSGISSGLKVAGDNTVNATAITQNLAGVQVQSGTLKLTPTGAAATSGTVTVFGSPASTPTVAVPNVAAVAAVSATLNLDATAGAITHTGSITNSGSVVVSAGTTTVTGTIGGTGIGYTPGLLEGFTTSPGGALPVDENRAANPGNFGVRMEPRMLQMNAVTQQALTGHTDNDTWIYTGYVKDNDGVFSFAENIDDRAAVWIDGALVLNANNGGTSRVVSTAYKDGQTGTGALTTGSNLGTPSQNFGAGITLPGFGSGWHLIEIRMNNGAGGAGPIAGNGFATNYGFGYKNGIAALDGADMIKPIDDGTGNLFVTPVGGKGVIQVNAGSVLNVGGFTQTKNVLLNGNAATVNVTAAGASDTDAVTLAAGATTGTLNIPTGATVTAGTGAALSGLSVSAGGVLVRAGAGTFTVTSGSDQAIDTGGVLRLNGGTTNLNGVGAGSGDVEVNNAAIARINGTIGGNALVKGGTLGGIGSILGGITATDAGGGTISPGAGSNSPGRLTTGLLLSSGPATLAIDLTHSVPGPVLPGVDFDQIRVTGNTVDLDGAGGGGVPTALTLQVSLGVVPGDVFTIILNDGTDANPGLLSFGGSPLANGATFSQGGFSFQISYFDDASTPAFQTTGGNDVSVLVTVPEPGSLSALAAAAAMSMGLRRFRRRNA